MRARLTFQDIYEESRDSMEGLLPCLPSSKNDTGSGSDEGGRKRCSARRHRSARMRQRSEQYSLGRCPRPGTTTGVPQGHRSVRSLTNGRGEGGGEPSRLIGVCGSRVRTSCLIRGGKRARRRVCGASDSGCPCPAGIRTVEPLALPLHAHHRFPTRPTHWCLRRCLAGFWVRLRGEHGRARR